MGRLSKLYAATKENTLTEFRKLKVGDILHTIYENSENTFVELVTQEPGSRGNGDNLMLVPLDSLVDARIRQTRQGFVPKFKKVGRIKVDIDLIDGLETGVHFPLPVHQQDFQNQLRDQILMGNDCSQGLKGSKVRISLNRDSQFVMGWYMGEHSYFEIKYDHPNLLVQAAAMNGVSEIFLDPSLKFGKKTITWKLDGNYCTAPYHMKLSDIE